MKKYHLATFLVSLETLASDAIFTNNGNYCTPFCILCFLYNTNYSIHIRMFVRSNEHSNPAKFVWALYSSTSIYFYKVTQFLSGNSYCNTISQSSFINFATLLARPLLKLKCSILLVMYSWVNAFYHVMNGKYSITLLFFGNNSQHFVTTAPPISYINRKETEKQITCMIGYSDFISHEWFL